MVDVEIDTRSRGSEAGRRERFATSRRPLWAAVAVVAVFRVLVCEPAAIDSTSMEPTLFPGDRILIGKLGYGPSLTVPWAGIGLALPIGRHRPRIGDVVAFRIPGERSVLAVKRVVAVGGQTVELRRKRLLVDGVAVPDVHARLGTPDAAPLAGDDFGPARIPPAHVFLLGDNRDDSHDSRAFGPVPSADVVGRAVAVAWSWDQGPRDAVRWQRIGRRVE